MSVGNNGVATFRNNKLLLAILFVAAALRLGGMLFVPDLSSDHYAEYGEIVKNLHRGFGYSLYHMTEQGIDLWYDESSEPFPSAYMPPGYVAFLYPFFFVDSIPIRNILILIAQIAVSLGVVLGMYHITRPSFGETAALAAAGITAMLPEFVYASLTFTPVVFAHAALIAFLLIYPLDREVSTKRLVSAGVVAAAGILLRSEFALFIGFVILLDLLSSRRQGLVLAVIIVVLVFPWALRNSLVLGSFVPLSTNAGLNLYRGHSPEGIGAWGDDRVLGQLAELTPGNDLEVRMQQVFTGAAVREISNDPPAAIGRGFLKLFHLWVFNPADSRAGYLLYLLPWLVLLGCFAAGLSGSLHHGRNQLLVIYLVSASLVSFVFFALPRYQTMMKIAIVPFAAYGLVRALKAIRARFNPAE